MVSLPLVPPTPSGADVKALLSPHLDDPSGSLATEPKLSVLNEAP